MKKGWEYKKLKDVALYSIGLTYKPSDVNEEGTIVLRSSNIQNDKLDLNDIVKVGCPIKESLYVQKDDILMCSRNGSAKLVGKVALIPEIKERMTYGTFMMVIRSVYNPYLFYYFKSENFRNQIKHGEANMINQITRYMLDDVYLYVPSLSEQQRIVDYLDAAFAKIDAIKANAEKALNEAKALFQAALKEMLEPKEGWEEKKFGDVCWYNKNNGIHKGTKYVGMEHIEQGTGTLMGTISSDDVLSNTFAFKKGDVLYGRLRPYLKKVIVADFDGCCSTEIFPIQSKEIIPSFLMYWFLTDGITNKVNATCAGCRMPRGNMNDVLKFDISYPPLSEQQSIVATLDSLKSKVDRLQANFEKISQECDALKQAILRQVFE